jgi:hypothetical protein
MIIATPQAQLNNRLRVIVSALLLGILTRRAVLVEFRSGYYAELSDLFDTPIELELRRFQDAHGWTSRPGVEVGMGDVNQLVRAQRSAAQRSAARRARHTSQ